MSTDSHYIDAVQINPEGLGRLPSFQHQRLRPAAQSRTPVKHVSRSRTPSPKPRVTRRIKRPVLDPVIEHRRPTPVPRRVTVKPVRKPPKTTKTQPKKKPVVKTTSKKKKTTPNPNQPVQTTPASTNAGFLEGSITIGGREIKKNHAAAGGATISGLLLWKLLF
ncbi:MAG: hypothetical protein U5K69_13015 [Balneolaceae bacterium]|nr:hypothetical protein [Balneolaceae bacterium]